jgi:putative DNA primase/helicase
MTVATDVRSPMTLSEIAQRLNGTVNGRWINVRGPHHGNNDRSLGFRFDPAAPDGFFVNSFAGDDQAECRAHVKSLIRKLNGQVCEDHQPRHADAGKAADVRRAMILWQEAKPPKGTIVEAYLRGRRCSLEPVLDGDVIRFHPCCPFRADRVPTMLALITEAVTGEPIGVHRTAIEDDGSGKRELGEGISSKKMLGVARGGVIRLQPASLHLGIAEGIETALSAAQVFGMPVWAAISNGGVAAFPILKWVQRLTVFADHDNAGIKAARECGRRYEMSGIAGEIHIPPVVKSDWNDWLMEQG